jgi:hypothetical protein
MVSLRYIGDGAAMNDHTSTINQQRDPPPPHTHGAFDHWAGRVIDVLAGVGLLAVLSALSGYIWGLLH